MRDHRSFTALALTVLMGVVGSPLLGDESSGNWSLKGGFQLGLRTVDVEGREEKYKEDFNLEDGPRLFNFNFDLAPPEELRQYFDHLDISMNNLGGDPFESMRFTVEKYGRYSLKWEQRKSAYFYEDIILPPELASPELSDVGDLHSFDFDRVKDSASLTLWMSEAARLDVGYDRFTKKGRSTTTYDIQRDEFEVDRPIDESLSEYRAGLSYDWDKVTIVLREHIREFENSVEAFLPGASVGENSDDASVLDFFFLNEPYNLSSYGHSASLIARPSDRLLIQFEASQEEFELEVDVSEKSKGLDYQGQPFTTDFTGNGEIDRDIAMLDLNISYRLTDRVALILDANSKSLDQQGALDLDGALEATSFELDTTGSEAALQVEAGNDLTVTAGVRSESREVVSDVDAAGYETDHSGAFALVGWHPGRRLSVTARFDSSSLDNPLTAASPSDRESLRLRARYARPLGLSLSGSYHLDSLDNTESGWRAEVEHLGLRAGYRFAVLSLSFGYSVVNSDRDVELLFPISYRADTEVIDARFSWAVSPRLKLGGDLRFYENEGSFALQRQQIHFFSEVGLGKDCVAHFGFRQLEYDEGLENFDDYKADIVEVSLGYRWR